MYNRRWTYCGHLCLKNHAKRALAWYRRRCDRTAFLGPSKPESSWKWGLCYRGSGQLGMRGSVPSPPTVSVEIQSLRWQHSSLQLFLLDHLWALGPILTWHGWTPVPQSSERTGVRFPTRTLFCVEFVCSSPCTAIGCFLWQSPVSPVAKSIQCNWDWPKNPKESVFLGKKLLF